MVHDVDYEPPEPEEYTDVSASIRQTEQKILVMPNDSVGENLESQVRIPKPMKDEFESWADLIAAVRAYSKEVGFAAIGIGGFIDTATDKPVKKIVCTKSSLAK